jgi:hypothetical protein
MFSTTGPESWAAAQSEPRLVIRPARRLSRLVVRGTVSRIVPVLIRDAVITLANDVFGIDHDRWVSMSTRSASRPKAVCSTWG